MALQEGPNKVQVSKIRRYMEAGYSVTEMQAEDRAIRQIKPSRVQLVVDYFSSDKRKKKTAAKEEA